MSVSLCVLRFEIADDFPLLIHLEFSANNNRKFVKGMDHEAGKSRKGMVSRGKSGEEKNVEPSGGPRRSSYVSDSCISDASSKERIKIHRGQREINDITIETFQRMDTCETVDPPVYKSKESSPILSEGFVDKKLHVGHQNQINFYSGNPFVEITKGILHLFKENQMTLLHDDSIRSEMLCLIGVPASMTSHDLLQFMAPCSQNIAHLRIIRDSTPNQYMTLIKFRSQAAADEFYKNYNGVRFNSIEPEVCHLVYISQVETTKESAAGSLPMEGHTELPTCTVCLERMDESVDGILTILCNHSFHGSCLAKWGDSSCPVCRYCQTPEAEADNRCSECHSTESLWICLICGHVGCGRYVEGHAYKHFLETQHTYAMQLGNNRVWDYAGDNYVHRLVQNKADGKLVELNERYSVEHEEKLDSMQLEYTYLLTSQLESQRLFFEDKITRIEKECHRQMEEFQNQAKQVAEECSELREKLADLTRDKNHQEKKLQQISSKYHKAAADLNEEKQLNECLRSNQSEWQAKVKDLESKFKELKEEKDHETQDLKEQVRDMMFYLEAQDKIKNASADVRQEIQEGHIVMEEASTHQGAQKQRRRKPR